MAFKRWCRRCGVLYAPREEGTIPFNGLTHGKHSKYCKDCYKYHVRTPAFNKKNGEKIKYARWIRRNLKLLKGI